MPRFYFNIRTDSSFMHDHEGEDHDSLAEAEKEAIASAREIVAEAVRTGDVTAREKAFELTDVNGTVLSSIVFAEILRS